MIFVNLPVKDLAAATRFYEAIGCEKNEQFSDHQAASMVWSDSITFHLLTRDYFATFAPKPVADAREACGALFALTRDSREAVDAITEAAAAAGGKAHGHGLDVQPRLRGHRRQRVRGGVDGYGGCVRSHGRAARQAGLTQTRGEGHLSSSSSTSIGEGERTPFLCL